MSIDQEIASQATTLPIVAIAEKLGLDADTIIPFGHNKAKVPLTYVTDAAEPSTDSTHKAADLGHLVLVTAMSPTPAGEGKTTTSIGVADGINYLARNDDTYADTIRTLSATEEKIPAVLALREPSLGPVFGMKGGAAGGGYAQVLPMEDINLHFTGDFAAIALANNLACAMLDNHIHHGNELDVDVRRIHIRRVVDLNDRALRNLALGLGGYNGGVPREDHFDIVVASEVMAVFCLATSLADLKERLGKIVVAQTRAKEPVTVNDIGAAGSMAALLRNALDPNLVQTIEHTPAFVHGGPFANIAHGCNSVLATTAALRFGAFAITEAGFGADLGAEKFLDIKCRAAGVWPSAAVVVATVRALKYHGGVDKGELEDENITALRAGMVNLERHLRNLREVYHLTPVVSINRFPSDTDAEVAAAIEAIEALGVRAVEANHWARGGEGAADLARAVIDVVAAGTDSAGGAGAAAAGAAAAGAAAAAQPEFCYPLEMPLAEKITAIAQRLYGAGEVEFAPAAGRKLAEFQSQGYGELPVCIAKTQYSFSTDGGLRGAPSGHKLVVREVRLSAGAGFVVAVCGDIMTLPGLPKSPAALRIDVDQDGNITGLF